MGLVTLACFSCVTGMQFKKKLCMMMQKWRMMQAHIYSTSRVRGHKTFHRQNIETTMSRDLPNPLGKSLGRIPKILRFKSITLITFVPLL